MSAPVRICLLLCSCMLDTHMPCMTNREELVTVSLKEAFPEGVYWLKRYAAKVLSANASGQTLHNSSLNNSTPVEYCSCVVGSEGTQTAIPNSHTRP